MTLAAPSASSDPATSPSRPFVVVQLSDFHIGADWADADPLAGLAAAVDTVNGLNPGPDVVLVTGDLADHAAEHEYEQVRAQLESLDAPVHVLPGNHDERGALRGHFGLPGTGSEPVRYAVRHGPIQIVMLDTTVPGEDRGALDHDTLGWLASELAGAPRTPTLLALHHPPLLTGAPAWDRVALEGSDQAALLELVRRHPQVQRVIGGHLHRAMLTSLGSCPVVVAPSTYVQIRLDLTAHTMALADEPAGFVVHAWLDGRLVTHLHAIRRAALDGEATGLSE